MCLKTAKLVANSVDPVQRPSFVASDLVYTVWSGLSVLILKVITVYIKLKNTTLIIN